MLEASTDMHSCQLATSITTRDQAGVVIHFLGEKYSWIQVELEVQTFTAFLHAYMHGQE